MKPLDNVPPLVARVLLSLLFLTSGIAKIVGWSDTAGFMAARGMILIPLFLVLAIVIELGAAVMLALGFRAREAALALFVYLVPVTLVFHAFWAFEGMERTIQMVNFLKNLAIMGGLMQVFAFGPGRVSLDDRLRPGLRRRAAAPPTSAGEPTTP